MKLMQRKIYALFLMLVIIFAFASCAGNTEPTSRSQENTLFEMELTSNYDDNDPFINERLFRVTDDVDTLNLGISIEMQGESGVLEIADNETKEVLWSEAWEGTVDNKQFTATLSSLSKEKEYVVRFTGTGIEQARIVVTSSNSLVVEQTKPQSTP